MKKSKKIIFGLIVVIIVFISGMFFASRKTEPTITSTLIQNSIEQASDLVTTKYHYSKVGKFENSLDLNGWTIPLTNKNFILTFEGEIQIGTNLSNAKVKIEDKKIIVQLMKTASKFMMKQKISLIQLVLVTTKNLRLNKRNLR